MLLHTLPPVGNFTLPRRSVTNVIVKSSITCSPHLYNKQMDRLWDEDAKLYINHQVICECMVNATRDNTDGFKRFSAYTRMIALRETL